MRSNLTTACRILALGACTLGCGSSTVEERSPSAEIDAARASDIAAVRAVIDGYQRAVNDGDAAAYGALFAEDAIRMPPNGPNDMGRAAIIAVETALSEQWEHEVTMEYLETEVYGDRAHLIADVRGRSRARQGDAEVDFHLTSLWLFMKIDGTWMISRQMWKSMSSSN